MQITDFHSQTKQSTSEEFEYSLNTMPNEILEIVFDQIVNQKSQPLRDIASILLTCKKWERILKTNPCISLLQTFFKMTHSDRFTITLPQECIVTNGQKSDFTSQELKLIDRAIGERRTFEKLLMIDSELFHSKSLFLSLLHRYIWEPEICKNSANQRIRMIAENQLSILNFLISGSDEEKLTVIKNEFIERFYFAGQAQRWHEGKTSLLSTLKKFRNLNDDKKVFIQVARCFGGDVFDIDEGFKKDREIVLAAVKQSGSALHFADESLKKDREVVLAAVQQNGLAFEYADERLKKDKEIVLAAVQQYGTALRYADESLTKDREIGLAAVQQDGRALQFADESLKKDRKIVLAAVKQDGTVLLHADESLKKDREIILAAVQQYGWILQYVDKSLKKDREIVLAAVQQHGNALQFADGIFKKDLQIVLAAVKQNVDTLPYAHETIQEIVLAAIQDNG